MSRSTRTCLHLFPPTLFLPTLLFIALDCIFSRLRFLLVFLPSHKSIPVSSSFFNFLCLNHTSYNYVHWMICQPNVFVFVFRLSFTKGHFPKLAECAHFHYENVDFGTIQVKPSMLLFALHHTSYTKYPKCSELEPEAGLITLHCVCFLHWCGFLKF